MPQKRRSRTETLPSCQPIGEERGGIVKGVVGEMIDVDNYLFFSLGKMNLPTESKIVSVGFFNQVLTVDSKALSEAIEKKAGGAFNSLFKD